MNRDINEDTPMGAGEVNMLARSWCIHATNPCQRIMLTERASRRGDLLTEAIFSQRRALLDESARRICSTNRLAKISPEPLFTDKDVQKTIYGNLLDVDENEISSYTGKQFIMDVLLTEDYHRWNAFCMGKHHRLGKDSPVRILPNDVFKVIGKFLHRDIENMVDYDSVEDILMIIEQTKCSIQTATKVYFETNRNVIESILLLYTWWI